jgi:hypothetical protein
MSDQIFVGDEGTEFRVTILDDNVIVDISTASEITFIFRKPNGDILEAVGELYTDGTDGVCFYNAIAGDIDQAGVYKLQVRVSIGSGLFYSSIGSFKVACTLI